MKPINPTKKNRGILIWVRNVFVLVGLFLIAYLAISMRHIVTASSVPLLTQQILEEKALDLAELHGLQGVPDTQKAVFITLGEWYTLNDAELGKDASQIGLTSDVPVFVLAIQGNVEWHGPGLPNPNQDRQEHYDNITVVLNARTAELVWVGSKYAGFTMPVPVD